MTKKKNQTQTTQANPDFRNNPSSASSEKGEVVQIARPALVSTIAAKASLKDKEPKVRFEHFFDIKSLENAGYIIKKTPR